MSMSGVSILNPRVNPRGISERDVSIAIKSILPCFGGQVWRSRHSFMADTACVQWASVTSNRAPQAHSSLIPGIVVVVRVFYLVQVDA